MSTQGWRAATAQRWRRSILMNYAKQFAEEQPENDNTENKAFTPLVQSMFKAMNRQSVTKVSMRKTTKKRLLMQTRLGGKAIRRVMTVRSSMTM